jgi:hypothetical protein
MDALIASMMIFLILLVVPFFYLHKQSDAQPFFFASDIADILSTMRLEEISDVNVVSFLSNNNVTNLNVSILEQILRFQAQNRETEATQLATLMIDGLIPQYYGVSINLEDYPPPVYLDNKSVVSQLISIRRMISGLERNRTIEGLSSKVFLTGINSKASSSYLYFGGYVGNGNISSLFYLPSIITINEAYMELDVGGDFALYINSIFSGNYTNTSGYDNNADRWYINESYFDNFIEGYNNISIQFTGPSLKYIGGGFIRISYDTSDIDTTAIRYAGGFATKRDYLSGIEGIINLYSSFFVPGILENLTVYLHYYANHTLTRNNSLLLVISNTTVYDDTDSVTEQKVTLNNSYITTLLDYGEISEKTIPFRFGFQNVSFLQYFVEGRGTGDAALITDVSGSMGYYMQDDTHNGVYRLCYDPSIVLGNTQRLSVARCVDKIFVDDILDVEGDRIGLVSYQSTLDQYVNLSDDNDQLKGHIHTYFANGGTCISCGIYKATEILLANPLMPLHDNSWLYTTDYQFSNPPSGWNTTSFNDSSWSEGETVFGFPGAEADLGNKMYADLWEHTNDTPMPIDFSSGINSTNNSFSLNPSRYPLLNMNFTGPSFANWTINGNVRLFPNATGNYTTVFSDTFEVDLSKWNDNGATAWDLTGTRFHAGFQSVTSDSSNEGNLTSDNINTVSANFTIIDFWYYLRNTEDNDFYIYIYNGSHYNLLANLGSNPEDSWRHATYNLTNLTYFKSNFRLQFRTDLESNEYVYVDDVNITTMSKIANYFNMTDYWMINTIGFGSVNQSFRVNYPPIQSVVVRFDHSTNDSLFSGNASIFCNLTHPGGKTNIWNETWTAATNPVGVEKETVNVTNYFTSYSFFYNLECGAQIYGNNTIIAFDNIEVEVRIFSDDGWDWDRGALVYGSNLNDGAVGDFNMTTYHDPQGITGAVTHFNLNKLEIEIGGSQCGPNCGYMDSGAFGVQFNIDQELYDRITSGGTAVVSFDYEAFDREGVYGTTDSTEGSAWIKARFSNMSHSYYLGYQLDSSGIGEYPGDSTYEILWDHSSADGRKWEQDSVNGDFNMDGDNIYNSGTFWQNVTQYINAPGRYYLDFGAKFDASYGWQTTTEGIVAFFDNVQFMVYNRTGNTYFRKHFKIDDISVVSNPKLYVYSDDGAVVYLNNSLISTDTGPHNASYWNVNGISIGIGNLSQGDNLLAVKVLNNDSVSSKFNLELRANVSNRKKAMVIMSDGEANRCHDPADGAMDNNTWSGACGDANATNETISFACYAKQKYNISIYTVAFSNAADNATLNRTACCDNCNHFYKSGNVTELYEIYNAIAEDFKEQSALRIAQSINFTGSVFKSELYSNSYIEYSYLPTTLQPQLGYIPISMESDRFNNNISIGSFNIPAGLTVSDAKVTSYSGDLWTSILLLKNSSTANYQVIYNLSSLSQSFENLGDPYIVQIPANKIGIGENNTVLISTALNGSNSSGGSPDNRVIYTININTYVNYSGVFDRAEGCNWSVQYEDNSMDSLRIPSSYSGSERCAYNASTNCNLEYKIDAINSAVCRLFKKLDVDDNGKLYINIGQQNIEAEILSVGKIPFMWGPTIMEVRVW